MGDLKKLKGRPVLKDGKRSRKIDVRFSEDEYNLVLSLEKALGIRKAELVRMRILSDAKQKVINAKELIMHLDAVGAEMGRVGNNINQLARHANTLKLKGVLSPMIIEKFNRLFEDYIQVQQVLEAALRKIIRAIGN